MTGIQKNKTALMDGLLPSEFYLSQNYPNPFKGKTTIKYCLAEKARVELALYNSKDEKVRVLFNEVQGAGTYETILDGKDFPAGVYYYRLIAVDPETNSTELFVETKEVVKQR